MKQTNFVSIPMTFLYWALKNVVGSVIGWASWQCLEKWKRKKNDIDS